MRSSALAFCTPTKRPERTLGAVRLEGTRPQIDGALDDLVWQQAPTFTGFVQRGACGGAASE